MALLASSAFLSQNWQYVRQIYPISKEDFLRLLSRHYTKLSIAGGLLLAVQLVVLLATCLLRRALLAPRKEAGTIGERSGLMDDDDDDDDDEQMV